MPPSTTLPVAGPWATCPLKYRKPPTSIAWENGPTGGVSSGEVIAVRRIWVSRGIRISAKHELREILMHGHKFYKFIIITIIMPVPHDSRETASGDPLARRFARP